MLKEFVEVRLLGLRHVVEDFLDLTVDFLVSMEHRVPHQLLDQIVSLSRDDPHQLTVLVLLRHLLFHVLDQELGKLAPLALLLPRNETLVLRFGDLLQDELEASQSERLLSHQPLRKLLLIRLDLLCRFTE